MANSYYKFVFVKEYKLNENSRIERNSTLELLDGRIFLNGGMVTPVNYKWMYELAMREIDYPYYLKRLI